VPGSPVQLTKKSSYGLIAALELARSRTNGPLCAGAIAKRYSLPAPFVEKILHELKRAGLVRSRQGRGGGYYLAAPPEEITLRGVLAALGESIDLVGCLGPGTTCDIDGICPTKTAWGLINVRLQQMLESLSLADLLRDARSDQAAADQG